MGHSRFWHALAIALGMALITGCGGDDPGTTSPGDDLLAAAASDCTSAPTGTCGEYGCAADGQCEFPKNRQCTSDEHCGVDGALCQPNGFCSFAPTPCFEGGAFHLGGACDDPFNWMALGSCDEVGFQMVDASATYAEQGVRLVRRYEARSGGGSTWDRLVVETHADGGDDDFVGPGAFDLADRSFVDCDVCVLAYKGCNEAGCARTFLATGGKAVITEAGGPGEDFAGHLVDVLFREVYIDSEANAIPLPKGESWCIQEQAFQAPMEDISLDVECIPDGTGTDLEANIADFSLIRCDDGSAVDLHDHCAGSMAVWIVAVADW